MTTMRSEDAPSARLTVSNVADLSGAAPSAVRFYENFGVISAQRTPTNQRRFHDSAACRIKVARLAQRVGLTVREISEIFQVLPTDPQPEDWRMIASILIDEAERRTEALKAELGAIQSGAKLCEIEGP